MGRKIIRNIDTKQKVYQLIPLKDFIFFVIPFSGPIVAFNLFLLISGKFSFIVLAISSVLVIINGFLFSEIQFGQNGLRLIKDILRNSKIEYYEKKTMKGKENVRLKEKRKSRNDT